MKGIAFKNVIYVCNSDRRVEQIGNVLTNADYEILLSGTANDNYYIGETRKTASLTYNPSTKKLKINGVDITDSGVKCQYDSDTETLYYVNGAQYDSDTETIVTL